MRANIKENINHLDEMMKKAIGTSAQDEKDPEEGGPGGKGFGKEDKTEGQRKREMLDKYGHLLKKGEVKSDSKDQYHYNEAIFEEMDRLKQSEKEAREEVLTLQKYMTQTRMLQRLKEAVQKQKHDFKIDNLKQQLTSNSVLWEQLAESEKREKILKQELERSQYEIATQEKIIERLKDDIKQETREKQKLIQYKNTKAKRLDELEGKAREFEVLENVDLTKLLSMLERKEQRIQALES